MTYQIFQLPKQTLIGSAAIKPSWKVSFFLTGTTTPTPVYTTSALSVAHTQPVQADSGGTLATIYLDPSIVYKASVYDQDDVLQYTVDPVNDSLISAAAIGAALYPRTAAEISAGVTPTNYAYAPYDLLRYGAVLDGVTDDGAAVRNWILASSTADVCGFCSSSGVALCATFTTVNTSNTVRLKAYGLTIKGPTSRVDFLRPGSGFSIIGLRLDRWLSAIERELADTGSISSAVLEDVTITDCDSIAVHIERPCQLLTFRNVLIDDAVDYGIRIGRDDYSLQDTWERLVFDHVKVANVTGSGSVSAGGILCYGRYAQFTSPEISGVSHTNNQGAWGIYTKTRYFTISSPIVRDISTSGASPNGDCVGISIKGAVRGTTGSPQGFMSTITGALVVNVGTANNRGSGIRLQCDECVLSAFNIEDAGVNGILADEDSSPDRIKIIGGNILFNGTSTGRTAIYWSCGGGGHEVSNVTWSGAAVGMQLDSSASATLNGMKISDCLGDGATSMFQTGSGTDMAKVSISGCVLTSGARGWLNSSSTGALTDWEFVDNDFSAATSNQFGNAMPTGIYIRAKIKGQTTNATATDIFALEMADNTSHAVEMVLNGTKSDGSDRAKYQKAVLVYRDGGGATIQGAVQDVTADVESNAAWDATLVVSSNSYLSRVTGVAATTINWNGFVVVSGT